MSVHDKVGPKEAQQRLLAKQKREQLNAPKPSTSELREKVAQIKPKAKKAKKKT